jgi:DNA-binding HxlR family transcriptional regulator
MSFPEHSQVKRQFMRIREGLSEKALASQLRGLRMQGFVA